MNDIKSYFFLLVLISISHICTGQNLLINGNFESGLANWQGFNNQVLSDNLTNSNVGNVNNGEGSLLQVFNVEPNETYNVNFNYRWVSAVSGNYNMTVRVREGTSGGSVLGTFLLDTTPDIWTNGATFPFTVPSGVTTVRLVFYKTNGNRPLRIDNVQVKNQNGSTAFFVDSNTPSNSQPIGVSGDWELDFSDEFNDTNLNLSKWYKSVSTKSRAARPNLGVDDWWWVESNAFLNGSGQLVLKGTKVDNNTMHCGSIESRNLYEVKYGYLEAKIKIAETAKGNHTAFWLQGHNQSNVDNSAADGAEVDIFESAWLTNTTKAVVHYDGYGVDKKNHTIPYNTPNIHDGEYHVYGLLWTKTEMFIYYDGVQVSSTNPSKPFPFSVNPVNGQPLVPNVEEWLWLSVGASFGDGDFSNQPVGDLSSALVDYVRVYKSNQTTLSTKIVDADKILIYPNPMNNEVKVKTIVPMFDLNIYDIKGQLISSKYGLESTTTINTQMLASGVYIFEIKINDNSNFFRLIK